MSKWGLFVGGFLVAGIAAAVWQAANPPEASGHSMVPPDTSNIAQGDPIATVVLPETLSANAQIGKNIFNAKCAACHGENATGRNGMAPPLVHKIYRPGHHSDEAFQIAAARGVQSHHWRFGNMPPVEGVTRGDIAEVVQYVRELQRANGIK